MRGSRLLATLCLQLVIFGCANSEHTQQSPPTAHDDVGAYSDDDFSTANGQLQRLARGSGDFITVSAVGDIMMGTTSPYNRLPRDEGRSYFHQARSYMAVSDIRFGNLEGTLFDGPDQPDGKTPGPNRFLFRTPVSYVERLVEAGFNVMSLANNHSRDFGQAGVQSTKSTLRAAGIQYSSKDGEVATFDVRGTKVALIAADYYTGVRSVTKPQSLVREIARLRTKYHIIIVSAHIGGEDSKAMHVRDADEIYLGENRGNPVAFSRSAIDAGADLLLMHGPHMPRGLEIYRDRLIVHSLGNFATGEGILTTFAAGLAPLLTVKLELDGSVIDGEIVSFKQNDSKTLLDPKEEAALMIRNLTRADFPATLVAFDGNGASFRPRSLDAGTIARP